MAESTLEPLGKVLLSGYIGEGPKVKEFEKALAPRLSNDFILTVNSGTSAIQLALRLANVGPGDEVISTPMTCTATNMPILAAGAKIVWADIDPWTGNIDPEDVGRKVTAKTKAIMCVHWGGYPCELDALFRSTLESGAPVIQDAAHAFGAQYYGWPVSHFPDYVCFSFQAIKELTTVDGGALACPNEREYKRGKLLRWYGIDREAKCKDLRCEEDISEWGYKFHMNDVAATIGLEHLKYVRGLQARVRGNAHRYDDAFPSHIRLRYDSAHLSSYWLYTIRVPNRDEFAKRMTADGIMVSKVHARNDLHSCFKEFRVPLPGVDEFYAEQISIPVGWWLTDCEVDYIIERVLANVNAVRHSVRCAG